jgi:hypothetical protein
VAAKVSDTVNFDEVKQSKESMLSIYPSSNQSILSNAPRDDSSRVKIISKKMRASAPVGDKILITDELRASTNADSQKPIQMTAKDYHHTEASKEDISRCSNLVIYKTSAKSKNSVHSNQSLNKIQNLNVSTLIKKQRGTIPSITRLKIKKQGSAQSANIDQTTEVNRSEYICNSLDRKPAGTSISITEMQKCKQMVPDLRTMHGYASSYSQY